MLLSIASFAFGFVVYLVAYGHGFRNGFRTSFARAQIERFEAEVATKDFELPRFGVFVLAILDALHLQMETSVSGTKEVTLVPIDKVGEDVVKAATSGALDYARRYQVPVIRIPNVQESK